MMHDDMLLLGTLGPAQHPMGPDAGEMELHAPTADLDGDGILDTRTYSAGGAVYVASDLDEDGFADHVTAVERDGGYESWQAHRGADGAVRWARTDHGSL
ncbi:DUF6802 family protein [Rhodococcus sp. NPDC058514]|uniref:DUF6802 family protein n=1 Tax=unclassified Rhodococcus (in: high G+C Gram-positive bacteria) TaxID=192944 RepID=UPI003664351E